MDAWDFSLPFSGPLMQKVKKTHLCITCHQIAACFCSFCKCCLNFQVLWPFQNTVYKHSHRKHCSWSKDTASHAKQLRGRGIHFQCLKWARLHISLMLRQHEGPFSMCTTGRPWCSAQTMPILAPVARRLKKTPGSSFSISSSLACTYHKIIYKRPIPNVYKSIVDDVT